jgi:hypothetical protein
MGATHFLTKTRQQVSTEMSLHVLAYNPKRMMAILGVVPLLPAILVSALHDPSDLLHVIGKRNVDVVRAAIFALDDEMRHCAGSRAERAADFEQRRI